MSSWCDRYHLSTVLKKKSSLVASNSFLILHDGQPHKFLPTPPTMNELHDSPALPVGTGLRFQDAIRSVVVGSQDTLVFHFTKHGSTVWLPGLCVPTSLSALGFIQLSHFCPSTSGKLDFQHLFTCLLAFGVFLNCLFISLVHLGVRLLSCYCSADVPCIF